MTQNKKTVTVFESGNSAIFATVKTLLDKEDIPYVSKGDLPWKHRLLQLEVNEEDVKRARKIIKTVSVDSVGYSTIDVTKINGWRWKLALVLSPFLLFMIWQLVKVILFKV